MSNMNKLTEILSKLDQIELEELLNIVKENKNKEDKDVAIVNRKGKFTMKEVDFLSEYYPKHGAEWCCEHLGRTFTSIVKKTEKLGLSFQPKDPNIFHPTKIYATPMDTTTPRPNLFLQHKPTKQEAKELKKDSLIDSLLSKDLIPTSRGSRPSNMISIECTKCHKKIKINGKIVGSADRFRCNRCMVINKK